jgi:asparagine synthase (glutamine-hydrolysing)
MCGIAAIFAYDDGAPGVEAGELRAIRDCMKPRGPDGEGEWFDSNRRVGLGHRRLAIIDLSPGGAQPMLLPERQLAVTFNGEIYNYRDLRAALEQKGHVFRTASDTEVLLRLYADRGEAMVDELRGMYAFAIWDGLRKGLFLARDPFGIKPLYHADDGKTFRLASQVKALVAGGEIDTSPEPAGHVGFFLWGHAVEPYTLYRRIRSLPAGSTLWVDQGGARRPKTFCTVTEILSRAERSASCPASGDSVRAALADSVRHHLVADVPVGIFLSSGLDSTTITALAAELGGTLRTVTLGFEEYRGTANDEAPLAESVARQYGASHQTVWVNRADFQDHAERLFTAMDCPSTDGVNTYFVSHAAAQTSLKVALSGLGGDELFGGYPSFAEIPRAVRFLKPFDAATLQPFARAFRVVSAPFLRQVTSPKYASCLEYGGSYSGAYLLRRGMFMPWELPEFLDADLVREGWLELQPLVRLDETLDGLRSSRAKVSCLEMCWYMRNQLLRDSDWAGMAHSLEIRVPLVDAVLVRALAPSLIGPAPPTKRDMASSPRFPLPASVLNRPKTGFSIPVRQWLMEPGARSREQGGERGLRSWAKYVYQRLAGTDMLVKQGAGRRAQGRLTRETWSRKQDSERASCSPLAAPQTAQPSTLNPQPLESPLPAPCTPLPASLRVLVLASDAFGGHGGIAKFNRDLLSALSTQPDVREVVALPRLVPAATGELPARLNYITSGVGGKVRYILAVLKAARSLASSQAPIPDGPTLVVCGHINLLPAAWLARRLLGKGESRKQKAENGKIPVRCSLLLVVHGIDAWQPTRSWIVNRLVRSVDAFISVSELTKKRFLAWAKLNGVRGFVLPNCIDLARFTPGPKDPQLLERWGLRNRTVLLTLARLSAQERYKGIDEVIEVLPELAKDIPNLTYLIVGDGDDRERLEQKARSLGLGVKTAAGNSKMPGPSPVSTLPSPASLPAPCSLLPAPHVLFTGQIPESEKVDHYRLADAFVMPGWGEGFGIAYLEAMGCGVSVVASKLDASQEAVRNGDLGIIVNPKESGEIRRGILAALKRERQVVPPGLEYFSALNFETRVHHILQELLKAG